MLRKQMVGEEVLKQLNAVSALPLGAGEICPLTQNGYFEDPPHLGENMDLEETRRQLIALRVKHGSNTPIGHRCSNLVELLDNTRSVAGDVRKIVDANIMKQMAELERLLHANQ